MLNKSALFMVIAGAINWGLFGLFELDVVAWVFKSQTAFGSRIVYTLIAVSGLWCVSLLFSD